MKQKLTVLVHKYNRSILLVKTQSDLSTLLGVSLSTIKRNYNDIGIYDTATYTVYVWVQFYDNGIESKYRHDIEPPKPKLYNNTVRTNNDQKIVQKNYSNRDIVQQIHIEPIETDWRIVEKNLSLSEYNEYYSSRSLQQLEDSKKYFLRDTFRLKYINKYGEIRMNE